MTRGEGSFAQVRPAEARYRCGVCRSIKTLRGTSFQDEEVRAAARQFVRKVSGYREPSRANTEAFEAAVAEIADSSRRLLTRIEVNARGARR